MVFLLHWCETNSPREKPKIAVRPSGPSQSVERETPVKAAQTFSVATVDCTIRYRPVRGAFLVRDGNVDDVVKAAGLATLLWGGLYCPIVPASADERVAQQLVDRFNVDILFPLEQTPEIDRIVTANPFVKFMRPADMGLFYGEWGTQRRYLNCLDLLHAVGRYWAKVGSKISDDEAGLARIFRWDASDPLAAMFALEFGFFPTEYDLTIDFARLFQRGTRAEEHSIALGATLSAGLAINEPPLAYTALDIQSFGRAREEDGLYVGDASSYDDLVTFWNLRAAGAGLRFYPIGFETRVDEFTQAYAATFPAPMSGPMRDPKFAFYYRPVNEPPAHRLASAIQVQQSKVVSPVVPTFWSFFTPTALTFSEVRTLASVDHRHDRYTVSVGLPERSFLDDETRHPHASDQHLLAVYEPLTEFDYEGYTLRPPLIRALVSRYAMEATWHPWGLRCDKAGLASVINAGTTSVRLRPLGQQWIIEEIFGLVGIHATPSAPGKIASRIIQKLGTDLAEPARVFKIPGVRTLLKEPASEPITFEHACATLGRERLRDFRHMRLERDGPDELTPNAVLRALINRRILRPAARAGAEAVKTFSCPACGLSSEVSLAAFEGRWRCPDCEFDVFMPPLVVDVFNHAELKRLWELRRFGLFGRDNNQEGSIPVLLALMWLKAMLGGNDECYSTALQLTSTSEIDFGVLQYRYGETIEFGLGEAKATSSRITPEQVDSLKGIARRFEEVEELTCYLIFAKTADAFESSEIELFCRLHNERIPVIALTNRELEAFAPHAAGPDVPVTHPMSLAEMARNTAVRYLGAEAR
jgi:hypothetical protein